MARLVRGALVWSLLLVQASGFSGRHRVRQGRLRGRGDGVGTLASAAEGEGGSGLDVARIEFVAGVPEPEVPDIRLTRSRDESTGTASFIFARPELFDRLTELLVNEQQQIYAMRMIDEEGLIEAVDVAVNFKQGRPEELAVTYIMRNPEEWERFLRFMDRYAEAAGLAFSS